MNNQVIKFVLVFFGLFCINILSLDIVSDVARDNINYNNFYDLINIGKTISFNYAQYLNHVGSKEPIYFLVMLSFKFLGFSYYWSIAIINVVFIAILSLLISKLNLKMQSFMMVVVYVLTDYYVFVLLSELHRLKLSILFFIIAILLFRSKKLRVFNFLLMILSHFQMTYYALLYSIKNGNLFKALSFLLFCSIIILPFYEVIFHKFLFYINKNDILNSLLSTGFLIIIFTVMLLVNRYNFSFFYVLVFGGLLSLSLLVGKDRINIFVFEWGMIILFFSINNLKSKDMINYLFSCLFLFSVVSYHVFKIYTQYVYLKTIY